jgi:hypothetical protein
MECQGTSACSPSPAAVAGDDGGDGGWRKRGARERLQRGARARAPALSGGLSAGAPGLHSARTCLQIPQTTILRLRAVVGSGGMMAPECQDSTGAPSDVGVGPRLGSMTRRAGGGGGVFARAPPTGRSRARMCRYRGCFLWVGRDDAEGERCKVLGWPPMSNARARPTQLSSPSARPPAASGISFPYQTGTYYSDARRKRGEPHQSCAARLASPTFRRKPVPWALLVLRAPLCAP